MLVFVCYVLFVVCCVVLVVRCLLICCLLIDVFLYSVACFVFVVVFSLFVARCLFFFFSFLKKQHVLVSSLFVGADVLFVVCFSLLFVICCCG